MNWYICDIREEEYPNTFGLGVYYYSGRLAIIFIFWRLSIKLNRSL